MPDTSFRHTWCRFRRCCRNNTAERRPRMACTSIRCTRSRCCNSTPRNTAATSRRTSRNCRRCTRRSCKDSRRSTVHRRRRTADTSFPCRLAPSRTASPGSTAPTSIRTSGRRRSRTPVASPDTRRPCSTARPAPVHTSCSGPSHRRDRSCTRRSRNRAGSGRRMGRSWFRRTRCSRTHTPAASCSTARRPDRTERTNRPGRSFRPRSSPWSPCSTAARTIRNPYTTRRRR